MANTAFSAPLHLVTSDYTPAPQSALASRPELAPLRLTRRGKFVLIALPIFLVSAAVLMLLGLFQSPANASVDTPLGVEAVTVTVIEGDTLWGIAREFAPQLEPREAVRQIGDLNNLNSSVLHPGAEIFVPTGS
ncbi:MAG: LysM peptidoglycan-binding domain-containing protein [Paeniglutamicibacter sp.]|jgi:nucleoid-associated protein YgaU|uniref:LysM peptidoglycan-binding domain-containing protein n=1 Tax=Arthrobacter sp. UCD-GKA TaxID=1913576 RepID=UPI0009F62A8D|nr:LysM peptidoglycan-binding domain-containing protein [Arthrobacter sp. UCD-GKA]